MTRNLTGPGQFFECLKDWLYLIFSSNLGKTDFFGPIGHSEISIQHTCIWCSGGMPVFGSGPASVKLPDFRDFSKILIFEKKFVDKFLAF